MEQSKIKLWKGFWDKKECKFRIVEAIVASTPENILKQQESDTPGKRRFPWYEPFIGKKIQMVEIHANNIVWYINNSDGKGLKKISNIIGEEEYGHKGVYVDEIISQIPYPKWETYTEKKEFDLNTEVSDYFTRVDPFLWAKHDQEVKQLREDIQNDLYMGPPANSNEKKKGGNKGKVRSIN